MWEARAHGRKGAHKRARAGDEGRGAEYGRTRRCREMERTEEEDQGSRGTAKGSCGAPKLPWLLVPDSTDALGAV
eukprot:291925-Pleurochrysis_carterae.AAC.1